MNFLTGASTAMVIYLVCLDACYSSDYFAAPNGIPLADGSIENPWNLETALSQSETLKPGDTLFLRQGIYQGGFTCTLSGTRAKPITVRSYRNERATIDCNSVDRNPLFVINTDWLVFQDFEMMCSNQQRTTNEAGSWPQDIQRGGFSCRGANVKFINLILHDMTNGIGFWADGAGGEVYGCLIYNNGWKGPDRTHGHGIYSQNENGTKRFEDNLIFDQFGFGIHCYGSDRAGLKGFVLDGNILMNNGGASSQSAENSNLLIGGGTPVSQVSVTNNLLWHSGTTARFGYPWGPDNIDINITDNYFVGRVSVDRFENILFKRNRVVGPDLIEFVPASTQRKLQGSWDNNRYWQFPNLHAPFLTRREVHSTSASFKTWSRQTLADANSQHTISLPREPDVIVRKNRHEEGRANIAILNWSNASMIDVDLSGVLKLGRRFEILNAYDYYGKAIVDDVYDGRAVKFSLRSAKKKLPIGWKSTSIDAEPSYGLFVVRSHAE